MRIQAGDNIRPNKISEQFCELWRRARYNFKLTLRKVKKGDTRHSTLSRHLTDACAARVNDPANLYRTGSVNTSVSGLPRTVMFFSVSWETPGGRTAGNCRSNPSSVNRRPE